MEQSNQVNGILKPLKDLFGFLTPQTTFIANAAFAVVAFLLFILQSMTAGLGVNITLISAEFEIAGGIIGFLVLLGLLVAAVALPLKTNKISPCVNFFLIGFMALFNLMAIAKWGIITILLLILILLPWALFTLAKKDDEVKL